MKVTLYMDVYPGWNPSYACASAGIGQKSESSRRLAFTVNVPDEFIIGKVDAVLPVFDAVEVDK